MVLMLLLSFYDHEVEDIVDELHDSRSQSLISAFVYIINIFRKQ
jgi:hypothetical protein